ncbi:hypothetical protein ACR6C2_34325 [Streptomyces sp. INA 01156]
MKTTDVLGRLAEINGDYDLAAQLHRESLRIAQTLEMWPRCPRSCPASAGSLCSRSATRRPTICTRVPCSSRPSREISPPSSSPRWGSR